MSAPVLWIILPEKEKLSTSQPFNFQPSEFADRAREMGQEFGEAVRKPNPNSAKFIGIALVIPYLPFISVFGFIPLPAPLMLLPLLRMVKVPSASDVQLDEIESTGMASCADAVC